MEGYTATVSRRFSGGRRATGQWKDTLLLLLEGFQGGEKGYWAVEGCAAAASRRCSGGREGLLGSGRIHCYCF